MIDSRILLRSFLVLVSLYSPLAAAGPDRPEATVSVALDGQCVDVTSDGTGEVHERRDRTALREVQTWVVEVPVSEVEVEVRFAAATVEATPAGALVRSGDRTWSYSQLHAYDAAGSALPLTWTVDGDRVHLHVDTRGAAFPVLVDPVYAEYSERVMSGSYWANSHAAPDWNGDGRIDTFAVMGFWAMATVNLGSGEQEVPFVEGVADGLYEVGSHSVSGDFDGDGSDEVVVSMLVGRSGARWTVIFDDAAAPDVLAAGWTGERLRVVDQNGDGLDDLVRVDDSDSAVVVNLGSSAGLGRTTTLFEGSSDWLPTGVGDLDGDGIPDLLGRDDTTSMLQVRPGQADLTMGEPRDLLHVDCVGLDMVITDPDADGDGDIVSMCTRLSVFENDGAGNFAETFTSYVWESQQYLFDVGDVDQDGYPDVATGSTTSVGTGGVAFYRGGPGGFTEAGITVIENPDSAEELFGFCVNPGGDSDGDGYGELVVGAVHAAYRYGGFVDEDGDGVNHLTDCDDFDAGIYPGSPEAAGDEEDEDCDGLIACWVDRDGDGYAQGLTEVVLSATDCASVGGVSEYGDCDDADPTRFPGAEEGVDDGVDQDCDGRELCMTDADDDGYRPDDHTIESRGLDCVDPGAAPADAPDGDCDDADPASYPGAPETLDDGVDQDCDGADTESAPPEPEPEPEPPQVADEPSGCASAGDTPALPGLLPALLLIPQLMRRRGVSRG